MRWAFVLGTDGSGKSSVLRELRARLPANGVRIEARHPGPAFREVIAGRPQPQGHYTRPRHGPLKSVLKLLALAVDWHLGILRLKLSPAPEGLVLFDRHYFIDVQVDPLRFRYGGPAWLPKLLMRTLPAPDLAVLLDAPAGVIRARKPELPLGEIERQRQAYLRLVRALPVGLVVDASRPLKEVAAEVELWLLDSTGESKGDCDEANQRSD